MFAKHTASAAALSALILVAGCQSDAERTIAETTKAFGNCVVANPGVEEASGLAAYAFAPTPDVPGNARRGEVAALVHCAVGGPLSDEITIILPYLGRDSVIAPGDYTVFDPQLAEGTMDSIQKVAWIAVRQEADGRVDYQAITGTVKIEVANREAIVGTFVANLRRTNGSDRNPMATLVGGGFAAKPTPTPES